MITEFYKVCTIRLAGESVSGKMSMGTLLYVYHVDSSTLNRELMDFIDNSILDSVCKLYPQSILNKEEFYSKEQLAVAFGRYTLMESIELLASPEVTDEDLRQAGERQMWTGKDYPQMPAFPVRIYMEKAGSLDDIYSPFDRIELRYPLKMNAQEEPFVKALSEFVRKALVRLEDIL